MAKKPSLESIKTKLEELSHAADAAATDLAMKKDPQAAKAKRVAAKIKSVLASVSDQGSGNSPLPD
jgi:hypothetical protein